MDTISREPSPSYLPIAGLIAGLVGLLLGGIALANASKANKAATNALAASEAAAGQVTRIDAIESAVSSASANAETALRNVSGLKTSTQDGFNLVASELGKTNGEIAKLQEAATRTASAPRSGGTTASTGPVVAGPGEYVVKSGDTGYKIASANGVSVADLQAVNPGVSWTGLKVGQKIKLPKK
jgi:LysM repeat protein